MRFRKRLAAPALAALVVLSGLPTVAASRQSYAPFVIRPYLTQLSTDRAVISWRQAEAGPASFQFQMEGSGRAVAASSGAGPQHTVRLQGLLPGTRYLYEVNGDFRGAFETIRPGEGARFVALGHTHGTEQFTHYPDRLLVARALELSPQFLVHTGDVTYNANVPDFRRYFFDYFAEVIRTVPIFVSPGNHDAGWPFVHGPNLQAFRELFPYPYPAEIAAGEAYYDVRWGELHFFFLSYSTGFSPTSPQRLWVEEELGKTDAAFKIVVYGGAQPGHYSRDRVLASLRDAGADLVLNGDGFQPKDLLEWVDGLPVIFVGTSGSRPHLMVYFEQEDFHLVARVIDSMGEMKDTAWFYADRPLPPKIDLSSSVVKQLDGNRGLSLTYRFDPPISSDELRGLQLVQTGRQVDRTVRVCAYVDPAHLGAGSHGERGFRTQYQSFTTRDRVVTVMLPQQDPMRGGAFQVEQLRVHFMGLDDLDDLDPESLYLF